MHVTASDAWHPWHKPSNKRHEPWWKFVKQIRRHNRLKAFTLFRLRRFPRHPRWQTIHHRAVIRRFWPKVPPHQHAPLRKHAQHKRPFQQQWRNRHR